MTTTRLDPPHSRHAGGTRMELRSASAPSVSPQPAKPIQIRFSDDGDSIAWADYVERHPDATLFHELEWKRAVARTFGHRARYLIARRGNDVAGVLPLFEIKSIVAGRLLVSVPYATYGGILSDDSIVAAALYRAATREADESGVRSLELRSIIAASSDLPAITTHATYQRDLPEAVEAVAEWFPRKARAAARHAARDCEIETCFDANELPSVWRLYSRSMRRLSSPNYPLQFFDELQAALGERLLVQLVRHRRRPVGGLVTFLHRDTMMPYFLGLDERIDIYGLSHFIYLKCAEWGVARGYRRFDFGRSRLDNKGASDFKRHCGFEPTILQYQRYAPPGMQPPDLAPGSPKWAAAQRVWRGLPLAVTRPLGGWLAKSIPG